MEGMVKLLQEREPPDSAMGFVTRLSLSDPLNSNRGTHYSLSLWERAGERGVRGTILPITLGDRFKSVNYAALGIVFSPHPNPLPQEREPPDSAMGFITRLRLSDPPNFNRGMYCSLSLRRGNRLIVRRDLSPGSG